MSTSAPPISREEIRDLGFGAVVSQEQQIRLLNRDGSFNVERRGYSFWSALSGYHELITMSWKKFYLLVFLFYMFSNALFGMLYVACGSGALINQSTHLPAKWVDIFFYSAETMSTIGSS